MSFWDKAAAEVAAKKAGRGDVIKGDFGAEPPARRSIRRDAPPTPLALIPTEDRLRLRLAEELEYARRMLAVMGDELSSDGLIVSKHPTALQSIDIVSQMLGHVAGVVRSSDPEAAVERIGMVELKARLTRKSIG